MNVLSKTDWEILNATADDWENLEQIHQLLGSAGHQGNGPSPPGIHCNLQAIADGIHRLVDAGMFEARLEDGSPVFPGTADLSYVWRAWFRMTPPGKSLWSQTSSMATT